MEADPTVVSAQPGHTVVIADSDVESRATTAETVRRAGLTAVEVETGAAALDASLSHEVALVILEVGLPDMTGYEVCREIKNRRKDLPIFFLSGIRTEPIERVAGLLLGADDFIVRPFDSGEVIALIRRFVRPADGGTSGVREPRRPIRPTLDGTAAIDFPPAA